METIHLIGAEDVRAAGVQIRGAADTISRAAQSIAYSNETQQQFLTQWLERFEAALAQTVNAVQEREG